MSKFKPEDTLLHDIFTKYLAGSSSRVIKDKVYLIKVYIDKLLHAHIESALNLQYTKHAKTAFYKL